MPESVREAGADQRPIEPAQAAAADAPPVELGAAAAAGRKQFLPQRIVDDTVLDAPGNGYGNGYGKHRKAMEKIARSVQRVDDPNGV